METDKRRRLLPLPAPLPVIEWRVLVVSMADLPPGLADLMPKPDAGMTITEYMDHLIQYDPNLTSLGPRATVVPKRSRLARWP